MLQLIMKSRNLRRKSFMTLAAVVTFIKINMTDLGIWYCKSADPARAYQSLDELAQANQSLPESTRA
jgi:hypothetical protein